MSQLNFFMTENEIADKLCAIEHKCNISVFVGRYFTNTKPQPAPTVMALRPVSSLVLWSNNHYRVPECSAKGSGKYSDKFFFDPIYDPIIEFEACEIKGSLISPGRIYYKNGWIKDNALDKLHATICKRIRKIFAEGLEDLSRPFKVSDGIRMMLAGGFKIELGKGGKQLSEV